MEHRQRLARPPGQRPLVLPGPVGQLRRLRRLVLLLVLLVVVVVVVLALRRELKFSRVTRMRLRMPGPW